MSELVSPAQAHVLVQIAACALTLGGALWGWRVAKLRGAIWAAIVGASVYPLWRFHVWMMDSFGFNSLKILWIEVGVFLAWGVVVGRTWNQFTVEDAKDAENGKRNL